MFGIGFDAFFNLMKTFRFLDFLDIVMTSIIIYSFINLIKRTRAIQLVKGVVVLVVASFLSSWLKFVVLSSLLNKFFEFAVITVVIVFQPELRNILEQIGRSKISTKLGGKLYALDSSDLYKRRSCMKEMVESVVSLAGKRTGAIIIFERETKLGDVIDTGTIIKAEPSVPIVENIFFDKSPLHDGAVVIRDNKVYAAGCILPLTKNKKISEHVGTRHRAALGISEISDALVVVVSEETGVISVVLGGVLTRGYTKEHLKNKLDDELIPKRSEENIYSQFLKRFTRSEKHEK